MTFEIIAAFSLYFAILVAIGLAAYKKQKTSEDFLLGGRSLNFWVTAISAHASDMSGWLFMGFPAVVYAGGLVEVWAAVGLFCGMFLTWQFVAPRLRIATEKSNSLTLSSYFAHRYSDTSGLIRITTAFMSLLFFTFYVSSGFRTMGIVSQTALGVPYHHAITVSVMAVILYTIVGGFLAVAWTDLFQGLFLLAMIVLVPIVAFGHIDGTESIRQIAHLKSIPLTFLPTTSWASIGTALYIALGWGLGYFGQPHILAKFMGIKNVHEMRKAQAVGMTWQFLTLTMAAIIGLIGIAFFPEGLVNNEHIFILMVSKLFSPFIAAFILCAILAAAISTIDSQVLVFASVFSEDIYKKMVHPEASPKRMIVASRMGVLLVALMAYYIAFYEIRSVFAMVKYAWSGLGASFGPLMLMSLYSTKVNKHGALAGILVGGFVSAFWESAGMPGADYPLIPGFILSLIAVQMVSSFSSREQAHQPSR